MTAERQDDVPDDEGGMLVAAAATVMAIVAVGVIAAGAWIAAAGKGWGL